MVRLTHSFLGFISSIVMMSSPARPAAAAQAASAQQPEPTTLQTTWTLGSRLSLAAVLHDAGAPAEQVNKWFTNARTIGLLMGVTVPPLPSRTGDKVKDSAAVLAYVLNGVGEPAMKVLAEKYTSAHSRVFELAIKSNLLLMVYLPGDSLGETIAGVLERNGPIGSVPAALWKPVVDLVRGGAAFDDVKEAVFKMHADIRAHLETVR